MIVSSSLQSEMHPIDREPALPFHVVGIGVSADELETLKTLLRGLPKDCGAAFVVVPPRSKLSDRLTPALLASHTELPVQHVADGMRIEPNTIYLLPPRAAAISGGRFALSDHDSGNPTGHASGRNSRPLDRFFASLAAKLGTNSIGILLSGTGSDGSRGVIDIFEAGGLAIAQASESAREAFTCSSSSPSTPPICSSSATRC